MMFLYPLKGESDTATIPQGHKVSSTSDEEMPRDDPSRVGKKDCKDTDEAIATEVLFICTCNCFQTPAPKSVRVWPLTDGTASEANPSGRWKTRRS